MTEAVAWCGFALFVFGLAATIMAWAAIQAAIEADEEEEEDEDGRNPTDTVD